MIDQSRYGAPSDRDAYECPTKLRADDETMAGDSTVMAMMRGDEGVGFVSGQWNGMQIIAHARTAEARARRTRYAAKSGGIRRHAVDLRIRPM